MGNEVFRMLLRAQKSEGDIVATFIGNNSTPVKLFLDNISYILKRIRCKGYKINDDNTVIFNDTNDHTVNFYLKDKNNYSLNMKGLRVKNIKLPENITSLSLDCFLNGPLESINLDYIENYGRTCFANTQLKGDIIINKGVIGAAIFANTKITSLTINTNSTALYSYSASGFCSKCKNLTTVQLPNTITKFEDYCFSDCINLDTINKPSNLIVIGNRCFYNTIKLLHFDLSNIQSIGTRAFYNSGLSGIITIPNTVTSLGGSVFHNCNNITKLIINNNNVTELKSELTTALGGFASHCSNLEEVILPNNIEIIDAYCFTNDIKLATINVPTNLKSIGNYAFKNTNINNFDLTGSLIETIGVEAFHGTKLSGTIVIPNTVTSIGGGVFNNCHNITKIIVNADITTINSYTYGGVFQNMNNLEEVVLPSNLITIGTSNFINCPKLTTINLSDTIESIGDRCFRNSNYVFTKLPLNLKYLGTNVPQKAIGDHIIPDGITSLNGGSYNQTSITSIDCGKNVTIIGDKQGADNVNHVCNHCYNLNKIIIRDKVTTIADYSFADTKNTCITIVYPTTPPEIGSNCFNLVSKFYVPNNSINDYKTATNWIQYANKIYPLSEYSE